MAPFFIVIYPHEVTILLFTIYFQGEGGPSWTKFCQAQLEDCVRMPGPKGVSGAGVPWPFALR